MDERYRTTSYSVLIGHSLGGLFGLHTLGTQPDAFDGYLLADPSVAWNDQATVRQLDSLFAGDPDLVASL